MTHYELLGVALDADTETIHRAYRSKAKLCHPDACPNDPTAAERFKELSKAHDTLSHPDARYFYDQTIAPRKRRVREDSLFGMTGSVTFPMGDGATVTVRFV